MEKPLLSVVVPVFNVEDKLHRCIYSIVKQSYKNLQIILIDDGSTDSSGKICDELSKVDSRIEVYHQKNIGLVKTRIRGTSIARGLYVIWVDSDDWIESYYFSSMIEAALYSNADLVVADIYFDIGDSSTTVKNNIIPGKYSTSDIIEDMLYTGSFYEYGIQPHGVTKLFRRDELKAIQNRVSDGICIGEDAAVVYPYICSCKSIMITDICGYHYVQNNSSITKRKLKDEIEGIDCLIEHLRSFFCDNDCLRSQLDIYRKYLILLRDFSYWDIFGLLYPYGRVASTSKLVIYGAGGMGRSVYQYCQKHRLNVVSWIDRNANFYRVQGYPVLLLKDFLNRRVNWDYVLIANTVEKSAINIRTDLINNGVNNESILWFSNEFLGR